MLNDEFKVHISVAFLCHECSVDSLAEVKNFKEGVRRELFAKK